MTSPTGRMRRAEVEVLHNSYQPKKAELEADASIPTTPENLARCATRQVVVREIKNTPRRES